MTDSKVPLAALDAEIARRQSPDYQWFPKASEAQTPALRAGAARARGMQRGELTGLMIARALLEKTHADRSTDTGREWMTTEEARAISERHFPFIKFQPSGLPYLTCLCGWNDLGDKGWGDHIDG